MNERAIGEGRETGELEYTTCLCGLRACALDELVDSKFRSRWDFPVLAVREELQVHARGLVVCSQPFLWSQNDVKTAAREPGGREDLRRAVAITGSAAATRNDHLTFFVSFLNVKKL